MMKILRNLKFIILTVVLGYIVFKYSQYGFDFLEKIGFINGLGFDLEDYSDNKDDAFTYSFPLSLYDFSDPNKTKNIVSAAKGKAILEVRPDRENRYPKKYIYGMEKLYVISNTMANHGMGEAMGILMANPEVTGTAYIVTTHNTAKEILECKVQGYPNSSSFIADMIHAKTQYDFYPQDIFFYKSTQRFLKEGQTSAIPVIDIVKGQPQINGLSFFEKGIKVAEVPSNEAYLYFMLRNEDELEGVLTYKENSLNYITLDTTSKRKVKCSKENGKYKFDINIKCRGGITGNTLQDDLRFDNTQLHYFQDLLENYLEGEYKRALKAMQKEYKIDFLNLGFKAAAKYGRDTGTDWDKAICESEINVKVDYKIYGMGYGNFPSISTRKWLSQHLFLKKE